MHIHHWLSWLNYLIIGIIACLLVGIAIFWLKRPSMIACTGPQSKQCLLPKGAFSQSAESYKQIGDPLLALQMVPPTLQLPDLRQQLLYYGKNGRPDAQSSRPLLHFSFTGSKAIASIPPEEKLYLLYDKKSAPCHYVFSSNNAATSLWLEANPIENEALIKVFMQNDKGELITEPEAHAQFKLQEKEFVRYAGAAWEIGNFRVDGTLLARQRARWYGPDRFLERHGGAEYKEAAGKQRIDFGENEDIYSVFVTTNDCLIWDQNQWKVIKPSKESLAHPLLVVKKIDERLMTFELWDVEGKGKIVLNILKSTEPWMAQNAITLQQMFKFVGARTRTQCVFEINHERMLLSPSDWLLLTSKGWKKLTSEEEIDNYVTRKTSGTLFVFDGLTRKEDRQIILGTLYNPTRSDFQIIELPTQSTGTAKTVSSKEVSEAQKEPGAIMDERMMMIPPGARMGDINPAAIMPMMQPPPIMPVKETHNH